MTKPVLICLLYTIFYLPLSGMAMPYQPAKFITSFSFKQFSGGIILLKAGINNCKDSLNFILDTGSGGISLDSLTCERLKLAIAPSDITIRGIGGSRKVKFAYNNSLCLPGLRVDSLNFHINNYELLTNVYGEHIDGVIGYSFLSRYIVKVNYDSSKIEVFTPGTINYPKTGGYLLRPALFRIPVQSAIITEMRDIHTHLYYDIGAGMCLLFSSEFAKDSVQFSKHKKMFETQVEGIGGKARMSLTTIKKFRLGRYTLKKVPVYIFEDATNIIDYPVLGGLIGNDLLRRFNTIINYGKKEIHLTPNKTFREPFDYSYTGMGIYYINGEVQISDVIANSPAEKAGLMPGDIVLAIGDAFKRDIQEYKVQLMQAGKTVKMIILRNGKVIQVPLKVKNILKS